MAEPTGKGSTGAGSKRPRPASPEKEAEAPKPTPESIGIEGVIRVGGHVIGEDGDWHVEEPTPTDDVPDKED